jgi:hypothetical protein
VNAEDIDFWITNYELTLVSKRLHTFGEPLPLSLRLLLLPHLDEIIEELARRRIQPLQLCGRSGGGVA